MTSHPREGYADRMAGRPVADGGTGPDLSSLGAVAGSPLSRRGFLRTAGAGAGALGIGSLLAACSSNATGGGTTTSSTMPLPRPNNPVKWPIFSDNKVIADNLQPEKGATLQIYNWVAYLNETVVKNFCKKYDCKYTITTFNTMTEALAKLATGQLQFDIFFPTIDVLGQLVETKMIRPVNHSYVPNIANCWPDYRNPFYDEGWRYTTPYSIYTTGMAWRKDKVNLTPGWDMCWQAGKYKGKVAVLDDYREGISLALLKRGIYDLNTTSAAQISQAGKDLQELIGLTGVRIDNNDYTDVPSGKTWVHEAWSGDMASSYAYLPKGTSVDVLGYWFPQDGRGPVANDLMTILSAGQNPVLSHLFMNYLLDPDNAIENYSYVGYMQPLTAVTAAKLRAEKLLPAQLSSTVVTEKDFRTGVMELELPLSANAEWESAWNSFSKGL
jgi:spermidine/putrescine transport system substrate-binding protein